MAQGFGDRLARGEKTAIFPAGPDGVSQSKWDAIFADEEEKETRPEAVSTSKT
jgi:hypothetical protein